MILCFSGTGNSAMAAGLLAKELGETDIIHLWGRTILDARVNASPSERIILVTPVYSWGLPPVVAEFIAKARIRGAGTASHHLVLTCGDDCGLAHRQWRHLLKRLNMNDVSAHSVIMPNTYTLMKGFDIDTKEVEKRKLADVPATIKEIAADIVAGRRVDKVTKGRMAWFKSKVIYPWFTRFAMSPKPFHADDHCINCGKCARQCPMLNISMNGSRPSWGDRCAMCLRCYHVCPTHSVQYGTRTRGKGQYICPGVTRIKS